MTWILMLLNQHLKSVRGFCIFAWPSRMTCEASSRSMERLENAPGVWLSNPLIRFGNAITSNLARTTITTDIHRRQKLTKNRTSRGEP